MIQEFSFPEYEITNKAAYHDLRRLYDRCLNFHRCIDRQKKEFKRLSKLVTKDLVFLLDREEPNWDADGGFAKFDEAVRLHHPDLVRTETKQESREREKYNQSKREERRPLIETRTNLRRFPHVEMQIEIRDQGMTEIQAIMVELKAGRITPETLVRYRSTSEWVPLCEFLMDWIANKATKRQISYLRDLQAKHGIAAEIPLDISRTEMSARLDALVPR